MTASTAFPDVLTTERLLLRKPMPVDLDDVFRIHSDPRTNEYNPSGPMASMDEAHEYLDLWSSQWSAYGFGYWSVALHETPDAIIGFGGVCPRQISGEDTLNLYYRFAANTWGHGYASELGRASLQAAFGILHAPKVTARIRPDNEPSIKAAIRLGLRQVGVLNDIPGQLPTLHFEISSGEYAAGLKYTK